MCVLSIIIPCYNYGIYLQDALDSITAISDEINYEVIIVNDGSNDLFTIKKLEELQQLGYNVVSHSNQGLAYTRNRGINMAQGKYILPLDADNKIVPSFVNTAIDILDKGISDIVYGKPVFFGEDTCQRKFISKAFDGDELFLGNYIDACAMYRKAVWEATGGYSCDMPYQGHEDWEFWVNASTKGFRFHFTNTDGYKYRIMGNSLIANTDAQKYEKNHQYIISKYYRFCVDALRECKANCTEQYKILSQQNSNPWRTSVKYFKKALKNKR